MSKLAWLGAVALAAVAAQPATALTLQNFTAPDGGPQFVDPDENRPFSDDSGRKSQGFTAGQGFDMWRQPSSGLNFSFSGGNGGNSLLVPGVMTPAQHGPTYDPQTHDPYPR